MTKWITILFPKTFHLPKSKKKLPLHHEKSRGGAVVARRAHNPKVAGSSPVSATIAK